MTAINNQKDMVFYKTLCKIFFVTNVSQIISKLKLYVFKELYDLIGNSLKRELLR